MVAKLVEKHWIEAVQEGRPRPFWSVMVPIYNCPPPHHLRETLESVVRQDPGPAEMQIEVIDNGSTADTNRVTRAGQNVADERRFIDLSRADFPSDQAEIVRRAARRTAVRGITLTFGGLCA